MGTDSRRQSGGEEGDQSPTRSRSRSGGSPRRKASRSPSRSPRRSRSHSRSRSPRRRNGGGASGPGGPPRGAQFENPAPSRCLGVFGLSLYTTERDLREIFEQYGPLEKIQLVVDHPSGRSRGFGFIYFEKQEDAMEAKERATGLEIDGHKVRIDFSVTKRAHSPTPGIYMGAPGSRRFPQRRRRSPSPRDRGYGHYRDSGRDYYRDSGRDRRRSPSPYDRRGGYGRDYDRGYGDRGYDRGFDRYERRSPPRDGGRHDRYRRERSYDYY